MQLRPPMAGSSIIHPRFADLGVRVCLVECYDGHFSRVFGPYPRDEAVQLRERWNRRAVDLWRYEIWEDFDDTNDRLRLVEPHHAEDDRWRYLAGHIAYETAPTYVVRVEAQRPGQPARIVETLFGPVPRKLANHATCAQISVLDWVADRASESVFAQPSPVGGRDAETAWTLEWRLGFVNDPKGPKGCDLPPVRAWPSEADLLREPEWFRSAGR